jgi:murein L,D-transpeptidase YcbB/YkuD
LQNLPQWTNEEIEEAMNSGKEQWVKLPQPVAVSLTYFTAWVDAEGLLQLREDVYGLDKIGADKVAKINARLKQ